MDTFNVNAYTPLETTEICSRVGTKKANMRIDKIFFSAVIAGCYLAFSSSVCLVINASPWVRVLLSSLQANNGKIARDLTIFTTQYQENAPGLIRMIAAIVFPLSLVMIVLTGTDLCTGSFMACSLILINHTLSSLFMLTSSYYSIRPLLHCIVGSVFGKC